MNLIDRAACLAIRAHRDHVNQHDGEPYLIHLYLCASAALAAGEEDVIVAALWLHDSFEDGKCTLEEIEAATNREVMEIVFFMSKVKGESNHNYYLRLCTKPKAARAKNYDLSNNFGKNHKLEDPETKLRMATKYSMGQDMLYEFRPGVPLPT